MNTKKSNSISFDAICSKNINFLIGSGASYGIAPTLELKIKDASTGKAHTIETLGKYFEDNRKEDHLTTLLMYYYVSCIKPILEFDGERADLTQQCVIENYKRFLKSIATLLNRKRADKQCNIFTTNYDNCFVQAIDKLYSEGDFNLNLNDGAKGFGKKYLSARNFNTVQYEISPFRQHKSEIPQINLIHLHGSVFWKNEKELEISVNYKEKNRGISVGRGFLSQLNAFKSALNNEKASIDVLEPASSTINDLDVFLSKYNKLPIVNPTKWKFHETVFEEHYYQMLRYMSYELEKENSVLIVFGFSFADEHILNIVKRALANPKLCIYICCFTEAEEIEIRAKFSGSDSIRYISLKGQNLNFEAFNKYVFSSKPEELTVDNEGQIPTSEATNDMEVPFLMDLCVGEVIAIKGIKIIIKVYEQSNHDVIFYKGQTYQGVSINEHLSIQRGFKDIIAKVEGEYLDESRTESEDNKVTYLRKVELQPLGHFENKEFFEGVKYLPMIGDKVFLLNEEQVASIYSRGTGDFCIGKTVKEEIAISLPWQHLFNTHIGVFGNTGSGKSNTLTKLYTELFSRINTSLEGIKENSQFVLLDFNGEYTGDQLIGLEHKNTIELSTRLAEGEAERGKVQLSEKSFWNAEVLGLLFKATDNTQKPFLSRVIRDRKKHSENKNSLTNYINWIIKRMLISASPRKDTFELLNEISPLFIENSAKNKILNVEWFSGGEGNSRFRSYSDFHKKTIYFNNEDQFSEYMNGDLIDLSNNVTHFDELRIRCNIQLINDLLVGYVQYEHIQPMIKRMEAKVSELSKVVEVNNSFSSEKKLLTVVSLRQCNQDIKKIIPLLLTLNYYEAHKEKVENQPVVKNTLHLIIDEAHNILSQQSNREAESWKDYRLELFEEIIKEGRKFGVFLTLSSQRPADISPTIMSQIHNFFIHRLVNDKDLHLIDNTISTLDAFSKNMIPKLAKGCCVVTGTTFDLPLLIQVDKMPDSQRPNSDDIDLESLWRKDNE